MPSTWKKGHITKNYRGLKTFMYQLVHAKHLKEFVNQEKIKAEEVEIRPNLRFEHDRDEVDDALEEDLHLGTIHILGVQLQRSREQDIEGELHRQANARGTLILTIREEAKTGFV